MIFSSTIFLFGFLPCVLICYFFLPFRLKNIFLLISSLFFYAWGELGYTMLMVVSIIWNYLLGRIIDNTQKRRKAALVIGVSFNLLLLGYFKYADFLVENFRVIFQAKESTVPSIDATHLPLGISFFTFQAISYLLDVYRRETKSQDSLLTVGLYISMFPQLIAGPIVRYGSIAGQLVSRTLSLVQIEAGILRFVYGLAKKLLIANPLGEVADALFALPADQLTALPAWIAVSAYSLQIYFDFSGYSDMAIGLGLMLGFNFPENFNYPYISKTIRDFWRRWHMSLTSWLRDYLYIPMGGSRSGERRTYSNLIIVFLLCGLWHGASWNFVVWGGWHGIFLILERIRLGKVLNSWPSALQHIYVLLVVMFGWVFFRTETIPQSALVFKALLGFNGFVSTLHPLQLYISSEAVIAAGFGILLSVPVFSWIKVWFEGGTIGFLCRFSLMLILLFGIFMKISSGTYNPFLYFRF